MDAVDQMLFANVRYVRDFEHAHLESPPRRRVAVVTCMDARLDPARILGLTAGDAHVIRNAGGCAREALRSLAVSQQLLGTSEIVLIRHTDCGMGEYSNEDQALTEDLQFLRSSELIAVESVIRGFVYDVKNGRLEEIL